MNSELFLKINRDKWERLNSILEQINQKGPSSLSWEDLKALGVLFRRVTADLAYARTHYPGHEIVDYLNNLVVRAHGNIYRTETLRMRPIWEFFRRDFPLLILEQRLFIAAAGLVLLLGLMVGYFLHFNQPALDGLVIPDSMKRTISESLSSGEVGGTWPPSARPAISLMIMTNNIKVGISSFALGVTGGIGTICILFYNGIMVGVLGAIFTTKGYTLDFWSLILPHGVLELLAIFICGGAGFVLAKAVVKPGDFKRQDALQVQGKVALKLVLGTVPIFCIAGLIEGFITPSSLSNYGKLAVGVCSLIMFALYIFLGTRGKKANKTNYSGSEG